MSWTKIDRVTLVFTIVLTAAVSGVIAGTAIVEGRAAKCIRGRLISTMTDDELAECRVERAVMPARVEYGPNTGYAP